MVKVYFEPGARVFRSLEDLRSAPSRALTMALGVQGFCYGKVSHKACSFTNGKVKPRKRGLFVRGGRVHRAKKRKIWLKPRIRRDFEIRIRKPMPGGRYAGTPRWTFCRIYKC